MIGAQHLHEVSGLYLIEMYNAAI